MTFGSRSTDALAAVPPLSCCSRERYSLTPRFCQRYSTIPAHARLQSWNQVANGFLLDNRIHCHPAVFTECECWPLQGGKQFKDPFRSSRRTSA